MYYFPRHDGSRKPTAVLSRFDDERSTKATLDRDLKRTRVVLLSRKIGDASNSRPKEILSSDEKRAMDTL